MKEVVDKSGHKDCQWLVRKINCGPQLIKIDWTNDEAFEVGKINEYTRSLHNATDKSTKHKC